MNRSVQFLMMLGFVVVTTSATAQVTVQQPVFQNFSVGTTVSVPDGGTAFLGGLSTARDGRNSYGFLPFGSSVGTDRSHSGLSVGVHIHDFQSMDEYLLKQANSRTPRPTQLSGNTLNAWNQLQARDGGQPYRPVASTSPNLRRTPTRTTQPIETKGQRYYRLGVEAEKNGSMELARSYYRLSMRANHAPASQRLIQLERNRRRY